MFDACFIESGLSAETEMAGSYQRTSEALVRDERTWSALRNYSRPVVRHWLAEALVSLAHSLDAETAGAYVDGRRPAA
jgi:hypothetical protein